jgi:flavin reductase (DIM6/NTAB) family NADH-FMN oxidoreductase RutF
MTLSDAFADLVGHLDPPMIVVTTAAGGQRAGCLVGFHAQCSIEPPRYVVWLSKANHTLRVGLLAPRFAIHFLAADQHDVAELFGGTTGDEVDKFSRCSWTEGPDGVPLLEGFDHRIVGRRGAVLDDGSDHVCVVIEPDDVRAEGPLRPLRLSDVNDITPGHQAEERPVPAEERDSRQL